MKGWPCSYAHVEQYTEVHFPQSNIQPQVALRLEKRGGKLDPAERAIMQPLPEDFDPQGSTTRDAAAIFEDLVGCDQVMG